jgi:hypothetical protein
LSGFWFSPRTLIVLKEHWKCTRQKVNGRVRSYLQPLIRHGTRRGRVEPLALPHTWACDTYGVGADVNSINIVNELKSSQLLVITYQQLAATAAATASVSRIIAEVNF